MTQKTGGWLLNIASYRREILVLQDVLPQPALATARAGAKNPLRTQR